MSAAPSPAQFVVDPARRRQLGRRAQLLAAASVTYNVIEAIVAVSAGMVAGSVALVGFGLDSMVEVSSGLIILWQFRHAMPESRERRALRLMACSFFALAGYVGFESVRALVTGEQPDASPVGMALAALSLLIMPFLSWAQRRTGRALGSGAVVADSTQTLLCTYLSAVLLAGLLLNATVGWWWADPVAGLVIAAVAVREGRAAWRGESCGCGPVAAGQACTDAPGQGCSDAPGQGCSDAPGQVCCDAPGQIGTDQPVAACCGGEASPGGQRDCHPNNDPAGLRPAPVELEPPRAR